MNSLDLRCCPHLSGDLTLFSDVLQNLPPLYRHPNVLRMKMTFKLTLRVSAVGAGQLVLSKQ